MNFIKKLFTRRIEVVEKAGNELIYISGSQSNSNIPYLTQKEQRDYYQGLISSCIDFRANSLKKALPILYSYYNQTQYKELDNHPFIDLIRKPNDYYSFSKLLEYISKSLDIYGNSYFYVPKTKLKQPFQIYSLPAEEMQVKIDNAGFPIGYIRTIETIPSKVTKEILFNADEIIHFKTYNPHNQYYGLSVIQKAAILTDIDLGLSQYQSNLLKNDGIGKGFITGGKRVSQEDLERLQEHHAKKYSGVANAGKTQFLFDGMQYQAIQQTPKDLDYIESRRLTEMSICRIFQVPPSALGDGGTTNKSTAQINQETFHFNVIQPILSDIAGQLSLFLKQAYKDNNIFIEFNLPLPKDRSADLEENTLLVNSGAMPLNELRKVYKYDALPELEGQYVKSNSNNTKEETPIDDNTQPIQ